MQVSNQDAAAAEPYDKAKYVKLTFNMSTKRIRMPNKSYESLVQKLNEKFPALAILLQQKARP